LTTKLKLLSVVGARPQFIKAAMLAKALADIPDINHLQLHTGQHYSPKMAQVFFDELDYHPNYDLAIGSGTHAYQTGHALIGIEKILANERPDIVIVYGDTNATLAAALTAAKLHIPIAHVESGLRSFNRRMPEEINRIVADAVSDLLFCPTPTAIRNLKQEGREAQALHTGDILLDTLNFFLPIARKTSDVINRLGLKDERFWLLTMHRPANVDEANIVKETLQALLKAEHPRIVFPCHPRTQKTLNGISADELTQIEVIPPVSYMDILLLEGAAELVLTDSGGIQREAYFLARPCITLRDETEWPETLSAGWNRLVGTRPERILAALNNMQSPASPPNLDAFGGGKAAEKMRENILRFLSNRIQ